jgi:hypothetical protein
MVSSPWFLDRVFAAMRLEVADDNINLSARLLCASSSMA